MTTYSTIADTEIDQDSPITQPLMTKFRDNPIAMAEGETGAPRVQPWAMVDWLARATLSGTTPVEVPIDYPTDRLKIEWNHQQNTTGNATTLRVRFSDNGGSSWTAYSAISPNLNSGSANRTTMGTSFLNLISGAYFTRYFDNSPNALTGSGALTLPAGVINRIEISFSNAIGASPSGNADIMCLGSGIDRD